jgi:glyoxylase-like metal-dependent hydrolase (beta-lactamase superfamily II)
VNGRWLEVGDGVLVRRYADLDLSVGLVVGDGACLVVDTRGDTEQGAELAAAIREVTVHPWSVALTHAHFDHCFGTAVFLPCQVWAQARCRASIVHTAGSQQATWSRYYQRAGRPDIARRLAAVDPVLPNQLFIERTELDVGGRPVTLAHPGLGHTDHDLVVHVPDAGVVFAGDLIEQGAPPSFGDAYPLYWPSAVDDLLELCPGGTFVPGHGDPVDEAFVVAQREDLAEVARLCRAVTCGELSTEQALSRSPYPAEVTRTALARAATS